MTIIAIWNNNIPMSWMVFRSRRASIVIKTSNILPTIIQVSLGSADHTTMGRTLPRQIELDSKELSVKTSHVSQTLHVCRSPRRGMFNRPDVKLAFGGSAKLSLIYGCNHKLEKQIISKN
jgi:hypothetical protein